VGRLLIVVIDTHILLWWVSGSESLSATAASALDNTLSNGGEVLISSISAWEISMLITKGRLVLTMEVESWLREVAQIEGTRFVPIDNEIAIKSTTLPGSFHKDPADRMIVATARKMAVPLVTADKKFLTTSTLKRSGEFGSGGVDRR
jgi:PIN domain nuclease of toxin-antitoxin system